MKRVLGCPAGGQGRDNTSKRGRDPFGSRPSREDAVVCPKQFRPHRPRRCSRWPEARSRWHQLRKRLLMSALRSTDRQASRCYG